MWVQAFKAYSGHVKFEILKVFAYLHLCQPQKNIRLRTWLDVPVFWEVPKEVAGTSRNFLELPITQGALKIMVYQNPKGFWGVSYLPAFPKEVPGTSHWPRVVEKKMRWQNPKGFGEVPNLPAFWEFTNLSAFWEVPQEVPRTFDQGKLKNNTISKFEGILGISHLPGIWEV